ncbi:golgi apparatus membrane protein-like protein tvp38 [Amniculicola lignicola CBS 123094]|uniref:Golgi apparatus membrane protein TVP38 n=1 Tax=Amniculicola lignicola CBS 123094 TaxID=1392246 RepID=A0A6A5WJG1_9PLEO|nr:golgi apparatus membrane protein-like protein tvp38 [Amniculicola lignicola CBS 123094]
MPAEDYDARALALPLNGGSPARTDSPIWSRRSGSFRRNESSHPPSLRSRIMKKAGRFQRQILSTYNRLSPVQRVLAGLVGVACLVLSILFLVYNERIFHSLSPAAAQWRDIRAGWLILWFLIFFVSFPPLIGYSTLLTISGFVYGFPNGWFIAASATVVGSTASFICSRSVLKTMVHRLIANDKRFAALALTLKHDGIKILIMIRMCPLPYSLSNGAIATFPTVHWASFAAATALVSPKLMLHIFVGAQLEKIANSGGKMDTKTKIISYSSIAIGAIAGIVTGWYMYKKTKQRARQLEAEERAGVRRMSIEDLENEYSDDPAALEAAESLREEDDDISLRSGWGDDEYHDDPTDTEDALEIPDDPFIAGDGDDEEIGAKR